MSLSTTPLTVDHPASRHRIRTRVVALGAATAALVGVAVVAPASAWAATTPAGRYVPLSSTRVLDTANTGGNFGPGETRTVDLSAAFTAPASAVVINLTAAQGSATSYQTVFPAGSTRPTASSLNDLAGVDRANSVTVGVGQGGANQNKINIYNDAGSVRIVVDVLGYYTSAGSSVAGLAFAPLDAPRRVFDSRPSQGGPGPLTTDLPLGTATIDYGSATSPDVNKPIKAVLMNITATNPTSTGYLATWNGAGSPPSTSTLNFSAGKTVANQAIVPVRCADTACTKLTFGIYNGSGGSVDVIGDIQGAYVDPGTPDSLLFQPLASPQRVTDTRINTPFPALGPGASGTVTSSLFAGAEAVSLNVTAVVPQTISYLTVWPAGVSRPSTSSLNAAPGDIIPNAVQAKLGADNSGFQIYNNAGTTNVLVDVGGVFVPDPAAG